MQSNKAVSRRRDPPRRTRGMGVGERLLEGMRELDDWVAGSEPLDVRFTVRTVTDVPEPSNYKGSDIAALRRRLGASQAVFARLVGVSAPLIRAWERNGRQPSPMARRLLDEITRDPARWASILQKGQIREPAA